MSERNERAASELPYEAVPHTGDLAIRVHGRDLPELFINAALGLFASMAEPPEALNTERYIDVTAKDPEALLVNWLNELIFLHETEGECYGRFVIREFSPVHLIANALGGPTVMKTLVVKAATFHELRILYTESGVEATIVFDI